MLRVDKHNPRAQELAREIEARLQGAALPPELHIIVGGDGWMLRSIQETGPGPIYLGLNAGLLGFLLNDIDDLDDIANAIRQGRWTAHPFPRLSMEATAPDGGVRRGSAVNDLYIERFSGQSAQLRLHIDGETVVERLVCDGLIVSTGLGSTAYNFSAGGIPSHPQVRAMHVTPIAPHVPRLTPFILPWSSVIEIDALAIQRRPVRVVADGRDQGTVVRLRVGRADEDVRLAFLEGHHFTRTLIRKVLAR